MIKKIHLRLTLVFTGITTLILIIMSLSYLYMTEGELRKTAFLSFQSDMNTVLTTLEHQSVISYEALSKLESGRDYIIALYDNDSLLSYTLITKSDEQISLLSDARRYSEEQHLIKADSVSLFSVLHTEFSFHTETRSYYACHAFLPQNRGSIEAVILFSTDVLLTQINRQRYQFLFINILAAIVIFIFSYFFINYLLHPIQESADRQTRFVAAASHELRTPLAVILSSLSAFKKAEAQEQDEFLQTIQDESTQMSRLVEDMLLLTNADNHTWSVHPEPTELDTLLLNCYESFLPLAEESGKKLTIQLPQESIPTCNCDPQRIKQIISVLIQNALSYTGNNGVIELTLSHQNHSFLITVSDNGIGIDDDDKERIFERFYRADRSRKQKGHFGLGLCIAKEIVQAHNGKIWVSDSPSGGSSFHISI